MGLEPVGNLKITSQMEYFERGLGREGKRQGMGTSTCQVGVLALKLDMDLAAMPAAFVPQAAFKRAMCYFESSPTSPSELVFCPPPCIARGYQPIRTSLGGAMWCLVPGAADE